MTSLAAGRAASRPISPRSRRWRGSVRRSSFYTKPEHVALLTAFCRQLDVPARIVGRPLEEAPRFARIQQLRVEKEYHTKPWRDRCHALCLAKVPWMAEEAQANPFSSERFYWIDAGIAYDALFPSRYLRDNASRCSLFVPAVLDALAAEPLVFAGQHPIMTTHIHQIPLPAHEPFLGADARPLATHMVGGLFGGGRAAVLDMAGEYGKVLDAMLTADLLGTEENVLTVLYHRKPQAATLLRFTTWYHEETAHRGAEPDDVAFYRVFEPGYHHSLSSLNDYQFD
jgi:hypothetical protein